MEHAKLAFWFGMAAVILQIIAIIYLGVEYVLPGSTFFIDIFTTINFFTIFVFLSLLFSILPLVVVVCSSERLLSRKARTGVWMGVICYFIALLELGSVQFTTTCVCN